MGSRHNYMRRKDSRFPDLFNEARMLTRPGYGVAGAVCKECGVMRPLALHVPNCKWRAIDKVVGPMAVKEAVFQATRHARHPYQPVHCFPDRVVTAGPALHMNKGRRRG